MVPQKAALKKLHKNTHSHTERKEKLALTTTHTLARTQREPVQRERGNERKSESERKSEGSAGEEMNNTREKKNTHTHIQAKMWEKRLNENYFKLFRKSEVEGEGRRKRDTK